MASARRITITVGDPDKTDSSSDSEGNPAINTRELRLEVIQPKPRVVLGSIYRGVRRRPCRRFAAEIRQQNTRRRFRIGTFRTEREAAAAYMIWKARKMKRMMIRKREEMARIIPNGVHRNRRRW